MRRNSFKRPTPPLAESELLAFRGTDAVASLGSTALDDGVGTLPRRDPVHHTTLTTVTNAKIGSDIDFVGLHYFPLLTLRKLDPVRARLLGGGRRRRSVSARDLVRVDRPEVGLLPEDVSLLGLLAEVRQHRLRTDRDVGHRTLDPCRVVLPDVVAGEERRDLVERQRSFGQADDDGLNLGKQLDVRQHHHAIRSEHLGPEPIGLRLVADLQEEGMRLAEQRLHDLLRGRKIGLRDLEAVLGHLLEDLVAEDAHELSLAQPVPCGSVRDGEVVALEADPVDVRRGQVGSAEESVVRVFSEVATSPLRHHQRELLDDLLSEHLELRTAQDEPVLNVTEDADRHVRVVSGEDTAAQFVGVRQHLECHIDVAAHAAGGVETSLDRHRRSDRQLEQPGGLLLEAQQGTTDDAVPRRIDEFVELVGTPSFLLGTPRCGTGRIDKARRSGRVVRAAEGPATHVFPSLCWAV